MPNISSLEHQQIERGIEERFDILTKYVDVYDLKNRVNNIVDRIIGIMESKNNIIIRDKGNDILKNIKSYTNEDPDGPEKGGLDDITDWFYFLLVILFSPFYLGFVIALGWLLSESISASGNNPSDLKDYITTIITLFSVLLFFGLLSYISSSEDINDFFNKIINLIIYLINYFINFRENIVNSIKNLFAFIKMLIPIDEDNFLMIPIYEAFDIYDIDGDGR
jgi:hypothetical protein